MPTPAVPSAYQAAAHAAGIPATFLWAVALQESGLLRGTREVPWPWTLNVAGLPARFPTREHACRALRRALERTSPTRIDVGLTQVNWGYHHELAHSPCDLLDPYRNLAVASRLLLCLHRAGESWVLTGARYHRPAGGEEAARYGESLRIRLARIERDSQRNPQALPTRSTVAGLNP